MSVSGSSTDLLTPPCRGIGSVSPSGLAPDPGAAYGQLRELALRRTTRDVDDRIEYAKDEVLAAEGPEPAASESPAEIAHADIRSGTAIRAQFTVDS